MPTTPILGIMQVSTSQGSKETTINDAILALENAGNATLTKSLAAGDVTLTANEATRNYIFVVTGATAAHSLKFPTTVNSNPLNRVFVVRNTSGYSLTVKFSSGTGTTVSIPNGEARLIDASNGTDMKVAAQAPSTLSFVSLTDVPSSYTGAQGKFLAVNTAENALEFIDGAVFPTLAGQAGKFLVVNGTETGVQWVDPGLVETFTDLTDTPNTYTGQANKLVSVKDTEDGVEFIDPPSVEAVEFVAAARWRIFVTAPGTELSTGFGEIEFLNLDSVDLTGTGIASASNYDVGFEPENAFDNITTSGTGWLTEATYTGDVWLEYAFTAPVTVRKVRLTPITDHPEFTPTRFLIQYYDGSAWVSLGDRIPSAWVSGSPQTFLVNGVPLSSVSDAPADGVPYVRRNAAWEDSREWIRDVIGTALTAGAGISLTVNDAGDTITINSSITQYTNENAMDAIAAMLTAGSGITLSYNDSGDQLTISSTGGYTDENAMDAIAAMLTAGSGITLSYNDAGDQLTITASGGSYNVPFQVIAAPASSEVMLLHVFTEQVTFADEWAGSQKYVGINPAATFTFDVQKNETSVGSIAVTSAGAVTFTTTGTTVTYAAGDRMTVIAQSGVDTIANSAFTFKGTKA